MADTKVTFGLRPHHVKAIEDELKIFGNREIDAKYVRYIWMKLGEELSWEPLTLALHYFEYLEIAASQKSLLEDQTWNTPIEGEINL